MADVVLSYAREDQRQAETLAHALELAGWDVWWDRAILPGTSFEQVIEAQLSTAGCVVVLWSAAARQSNWVRDEASLALRRNVLVQVSLDGSEPPLGFRQQQIVDLAHWDGSTTDAAFTRLTQGIANVVASDARAPESRPVTAPAIVPRTRRAWRTPAILALGAVIVVGTAMWATGVLPVGRARVPGDAPASHERGIGAGTAAVTVPADATVTLPREQVRVTVLSGTLQRVNAETRSVLLRVRFANAGTRSFYRTYYSSLRLLVDGTSHAPDNPPLEQVDAASAREFDYRFDVPAGARRGVLRVTHDDQMGEIPLGLDGTGR